MQQAGGVVHVVLERDAPRAQAALGDRVDLKAALAKTGDDAASVDELNAKVTKLNEESQKMGTAMYAAAQAEQSSADGAAGAGDAGAAGAGSAGEGAGSADDDVVDAEVVEDDDPRK